MIVSSGWAASDAGCGCVNNLSQGHPFTLSNPLDPTAHHRHPTPRRCAASDERPQSAGPGDVPAPAAGVHGLAGRAPRDPGRSGIRRRHPAAARGHRDAALPAAAARRARERAAPAPQRCRAALGGGAPAGGSRQRAARHHRHSSTTVRRVFVRGGEVVRWASDCYCTRLCASV